MEMDEAVIGIKAERRATANCRSLRKFVRWKLRICGCCCIAFLLETIRQKAYHNFV